MNQEKVDVAVVGAGVVGLSVAAALATRGRSVLVIEKEAGAGRGISSRSSEVVHAGIYHPSDSLKTVLCVQGNRMIWERCQRLRIPHQKTGKLILAQNRDEEERLHQLYEQGLENGLETLKFLSAGEVKSREPRVRAVSAIWSPSSGIISAMDWVRSCQMELEEKGGLVLFHHKVESVQRVGGEYRLEVISGRGEQAFVLAQSVVNAAGLYGDRLAELLGIPVDSLGYRIHYCKGDYFSWNLPDEQSSPCHLLYPLPGKLGLGIHLTLDLQGKIRLGPDAEYVDQLSYEVNPDKARQFAESVQGFLPMVKVEELIPESAGIRPKLSSRVGEFRDFVLAEESDRGYPGFVNCIGIESPGLTASPAIGEWVADLLE